jgi:hypothetical protein
MLPIVLIPLPVASVIAGLIGSYAATKYINSIEPRIQREIRDLINESETAFDRPKRIKDNRPNKPAFSFRDK